uniref:Glucosidase 2 subunit beta-like n=1 Tax=Saccoglossus kowalevskii TaxID=10224 RepID=A0ABM0MTG7_SACKO|nr:PREDICTED: glucosidase 2 subunit beta-like [Saccoglossus kowalevskii]
MAGNSQSGVRGLYKTVRGIDPKLRKLYTPDRDDMFECLDRSEKIPFARLNDNYCDCPDDGSDEPGTNACPSGKFYCIAEERFVPSNRINDGICDCCDGADEWGSKPDIGQLPKSLLVFNSPCENRCGPLNVMSKKRQII